MAHTQLVKLCDWQHLLPVCVTTAAGQVSAFAEIVAGCNGMVAGANTVRLFAVQPDGNVTVIDWLDVLSIDWSACKSAKRDRPFSVLCAPNGERVAVRDETPDDAPIGTPPIVAAYTLDGSVWSGDITTLRDCGSEQIDVGVAQWFCVHGENRSRTDFWNVAVTPRVLEGSLWQDVSGNVVPAPGVGDTVLVGQCVQLPVVRTGVARFSGPQTIDKAVVLSTAAAGARLTGVSVNVIAGRPSVQGSLPIPAAGSVAAAQAVYTYTWSSRDGADIEDFVVALSGGDVVDVFWTVEE